jgi:hypothetical protein
MTTHSEDFVSLEELRSVLSTYAGPAEPRERPARARRAAARRHFGRRRVVLIAAVGATLTVVGAGVAAATDALPWWNSERAISSFAVAGSTVRVSVPGPESTTFEVVTNTMMVGGERENCTAIAVKYAQGRSQQGLTGCGAPGAIEAKAGSFDWQAPSGVTYAVIGGPTPVSTAVKVALLDSNGDTATTEPVGDGYYLVYAPARLSTGNLVFYDASGQVVGQLASPHS